MKKLRLYLSEQLLHLAKFISPNTVGAIRLQQYVRDYFFSPTLINDPDQIKEGKWYEVSLLNSKYMVLITPKEQENFIIAYYNLEETKSILPQLKPVKCYADFLFYTLNVINDPKEITDEKDLKYLNYRYEVFLTTKQN